MAIQLYSSGSARENEVLHRYTKDLQEREELLEEMLLEGGSGSGMELTLRQNIPQLQKSLVEISIFGNYDLCINRKNRRDVISFLKKADQIDSRLTKVSSFLKDLTGAGAEIPDRISLSPWERRALLELKGRPIVCYGGKTVYLQVTRDPLRFRPGSAWKSYKKHAPLLCVFTPYRYGPTNDSFTQSKFGRIMQVVLGILLSPLLILLTLVYLPFTRESGRAQHGREVDVHFAEKEGEESWVMVN